MGQKINPISLRLNLTNRFFDDCWYSKYYYSNLLNENIKTRVYLNSILKQINYPTARFYIQTFHKKTKIYIFFCSPLKSRTIRSKLFGINPLIGGKKRKKAKSVIGYNQQLFDNNFYQIKTKALKRNHLNSNYVYPYFKDIVKENRKKVDLDKKIYFQYFILQYYFLNKKKNKQNKACGFNFSKEKLNKIKQKMSFLQPISQTQFLYLKDFLFSIFYYDFLKEKLQRFNKNIKTLIYTNQKQNSLIGLQNITTIKPFILSNNSLTTNQFIKGLPFNLTYRKHLELILSKNLGTDIIISPIKTYNDFQSALFLAEEIVYFIQRRVPFRKIKNRIIKEVKNHSNIKGIRIKCSGRVGGRSKKAQKAKIESVKYGQTSLHVFSAFIDFASKTALTAFGSVGVKVWVCYQ